MKKIHRLAKSKICQNKSVLPKEDVNASSNKTFMTPELNTKQMHNKSRSKKESFIKHDTETVSAKQKANLGIKVDLRKENFEVDKNENDQLKYKQMHRNSNIKKDYTTNGINQYLEKNDANLYLSSAPKIHNTNEENRVKLQKEKESNERTINLAKTVQKKAILTTGTMQKKLKTSENFSINKTIDRQNMVIDQFKKINKNNVNLNNYNKTTYQNFIMKEINDKNIKQPVVKPKLTRGRTPRLDPEMAKFMGRIYLEKTMHKDDHIFYVPNFELQQRLRQSNNAKRIKNHQKSVLKIKKENCVTDQDVFSACQGLLLLMKDLQNDNDLSKK